MRYQVLANSLYQTDDQSDGVLCEAVNQLVEDVHYLIGIQDLEFHKAWEVGDHS